MKTSNTKENYINYIKDNLKNSNYSEEYVNDVINKLDVNNIDKLLKTNQYGYLLKNVLRDNEELKFIRSNPKEVRYYIINDICSLERCDSAAICVRNSDGTYNVAFSFKHPKDSCSKKYSRYCLVNYLLNRYRFNNIKATSSITAICVAWNVNYKKFPNCRKKCNIVPTISYCECRAPKGLNCVNVDEEPALDSVKEYCKIGNKYKIAKENMLDKGIDITNIKYYMELTRVSAMAIKTNKGFDVTFSFMDRKDYNFSWFLQNVDYKKISKYCLYQNYLNKKYTYHVHGTPNSITSVVRAYNEHVSEFPSDFKRTKVKTNIISCRNGLLVPVGA